MRLERDSMGTVEVPVEAYYGAQTQRALHNFAFTPRMMPKAFIIALAHIKKAAAKTNAQLQCISQDYANAIIQACDQIIAGQHLAHFPVNVFQTGSGTSTNMNINEVLAHIANHHCAGIDPQHQIHPNDHVNYGQSSNDVIPTALQLSVSQQLHTELLPALRQLANRLNGLSDDYRDIIKTGRTHLMDAMPLSLGDEFATWAYQIGESIQRIEDSCQRLHRLPLGGTAIGTGINSHRDFAKLAVQTLAEQTALPLTSSENKAAQISSQDAVTEIHGQLKVLATVLIKQSNDLRWMNSGPYSGLGELQLKSLQPGSSIMPGKVNPVIPEAIAMMCAKVIGHDTTVIVANQSGNFQLNVMLPLLADTLLSSIDLLTDAVLAMADKAFDGIMVNEQMLRQQASKNPILVTALNSIIGYDKAAEIAKTAIKENRSMIDVAKELTDLNEEELIRLLDPKKLARPFD